MRVLVAGAGIIGLTTAVGLRAAGHAVHLVAPELAAVLAGPAPDPSRLRVAGATHAAAGMLAPVAETQHGQDALGPLLRRAWAGWPALIELLTAAGAGSTGHRTEGSWIVAADAADRDAWAHLLARTGPDDGRLTPVTARALRSASPALAPGLAGGWDAPDDHQVDPRALAATLLRALIRPACDVLPGPSARLTAGQVTEAVQEEEHVRVRIRSAGDGGVQGDAPGESVPTADAGRRPEAVGEAEATADVAVLAAGLGHGLIAGDPTATPLPLRPVHGDVLRLRVPADQLLPGEDHLLDRTVRGLVHGRQVYLVPRADGTLVVGATAREDRLAGTRAGGVLDLLQDACTLVPALRDCELHQVHTAARPGTPDDRPCLGALPHAPRIVVSTGYHRHGILLAPWAAEAGCALAEHAGGVLPQIDPTLAATLAAADPARFDGTSAHAPTTCQSDARSAHA